MRCLIVFGVAIVANGSAIGQQLSFGPMNFSGTMAWAAMRQNTVNWQKMDLREQDDEPDDAVTPALALSAPPLAAAATVRSTFSPDAAITRKVQTELIEGVAKSAPQGVAELRQKLVSGEMRRAYVQGLTPIGVRPNDAIDSLAAFMMTTWAITNNELGSTATPRMFRAVRAQVARAYQPTARLLDSNAKRQEFGESLMYQTVIYANVEQAMQGLPMVQRRRLADQYHAASLKLLGFDLRQLELTEAGFRRRG